MTLDWGEGAQALELLEPLGLDSAGPRVVAIGGGHGLSACLQAVQSYASSITAIVAVADDGGSSGRLTHSVDVPPPGDIRRCLLAMSPEPSIWSELFTFRFEGASDDPADLTPRDVAGHSLGNLILAALFHLTGDFPTAVERAGELLGSLGRVIPASPHRMYLSAQVGGRMVEGQVAVARARGGIEKLFLEPADAEASPSAVEAIEQADQILLGPGSLFTSVLAAVAVPGIAEAINRSEGRIVFVLNLVTQDGETFHLSGAGHVEAVHTHGGLIRSGTVLAHQGPLRVPEGLQRVELDEVNAAILGWNLATADVVDRVADWPAHDVIRLGQALSTL